MSGWQGPIRTIVDLDGPDSPGAQPYGSAVSPGSAPNTQLTLAIAASNPLPNRPAGAPGTGFFFASPSANLPATQPTTYIAQITPPASGGYSPGDTVRIFFTKAQLNGNNVTVQTAPGGNGTTLGVILNSGASASGFGWIDIQLNAGGTAWTAIDGGYL